MGWRMSDSAPLYALIILVTGLAAAAATIHFLITKITTIGRALGDESGRAAIACASQARTMAQHTYRHRASEILGFAEQLRARR
jgi:hypothetical protein